MLDQVLLVQRLFDQTLRRGDRNEAPGGAGLLLLLEYVRARAQAGQVAAAWTLARPISLPGPTTCRSGACA